MEPISVVPDDTRYRRLSEDEDIVYERDSDDEFYETFETSTLAMHLRPKRPIPPCPFYGEYCLKPCNKWKLIAEAVAKDERYRTLGSFIRSFDFYKGKGSTVGYGVKRVRSSSRGRSVRTTARSIDLRRNLEDEETTVMATMMAKTIELPLDAATFLEKLASMTPRLLLNWLSNTLFDRSFFDNIIQNKILVETFRLAMFNNDPRHIFMIMVLGLFINRATVRDCVNTMLNRCCDYKDDIKIISPRHIIILLYLLQVRQIPHMPVLEDECVQDLENIFRQVFENRRCLWIVAMEFILRRGDGLNGMLLVCRQKNFPESVKCVIRNYFNDIVLNFIDHENNKTYMHIKEPVPRWGYIWLAPMYDN